MDNNIDKSAVNAMEHNEKDNDSSTPGTPPARSEDVEKIGTSTAVDKETEKRLLKKLDVRIIPMVCWMYGSPFLQSRRRSSDFNDR
jgi:hypothetical protein